jgi:hypothetical protein
MDLALRKETLINGKTDAWKFLRWNRNPALRKEALINWKLLGWKGNLHQERKETLINGRW